MKRELNLFTRWLIKHYETSDISGYFCYTNIRIFYKILQKTKFIFRKQARILSINKSSILLKFHPFVYFESFLIKKLN